MVASFKRIQGKIMQTRNAEHYEVQYFLHTQNSIVLKCLYFPHRIKIVIFINSRTKQRLFP